MKKKLVLKSWVEKLLGVIVILSIMIVASECDNLKLFAISHIVAGIIILLIAIIFLKYGRDYD